MIQKSTILLASISLGLVACGGGGGGGTTTATTTPTKTTTTTPTTNTPDGSSTNQVPTTVSRTPNGIPVLPAAAGSKRVGYLNAEVVTENIPTPPAQYTPANFRYNEYEKFLLPDGRLTENWSYVIPNDGIDEVELVLIDGKPLSTVDLPLVGDSVFFDREDESKDSITLSMLANAIAFRGKDGKSYAGYQFYEDKAPSFDLKPHEAGSHRWTNVRYTYTTALDGQKPVELDSSLNDGTITVNGADWNAVLGNVTLDGKISGTDVAGTATGNFYGQTITGEFAGFDGTSRPKGSDKAYLPGTTGGFIGQSDTAAFSGTWINDEATKFSQ